MAKDIDRAFQVVARANFLPDEIKGLAGIDAPLPIGFGQTNSQPSTVYVMLGWLAPQAGDKVLDVGSGSGWTTALLSYLVGSKGAVYAVEREPALVTFGAENCHRIGLTNVHFYKAGKEYGLPKHAPYDAILVSAAAPELPESLVDQLVVGGRLVIPVRSSVLVIDKTSEGVYDSEEHTGFFFVPLV